ncbi:hypothetical protein BMS3Bbin06_01115 [bacterium BMS3Bbin06]|nr:hypothetical protein BMS3Abin08_00983 [bacterium BMS3Abin08]GBE34588.1 hypothetical protein BMS3Bbin06_01115 [bacterium BMS3Bbin06]
MVWATARLDYVQNKRVFTIKGVKKIIVVWHKLCLVGLRSVRILPETLPREVSGRIMSESVLNLFQR